MAKMDVIEGKTRGNTLKKDVEGLESGSGPDIELSLDMILEVLSNERRRRVCQHIPKSESTTIGDLAEHIAARENDTEEGLLSSAQRKRVYIALYQCHLPKMDDFGVIEFETARKEVRTGAHYAVVSACLGALKDEMESLDGRQECRQSAPVWRRAKWWLVGADFDAEA